MTNTGFPKGWNGRGFTSTVKGEALSLDAMVAKANALNLEGKVSVVLPQKAKSVFSVYNSTFNLEAQQKFHFDAYSGELIKHYNWSDVGVLMRGRMWFMAFHQGQFNSFNWGIMLFVAFALFVLSLSGFLSYVYRKVKGELGTPKAPKNFKVGYGVITAIVVLSIVFPIFGASVLLIVIAESLFKLKKA